MQARHANVVGANDAAAHLTRDPGRLIRGRGVGGARGQHGYHATCVAGRLGIPPRGQDGATVRRNQHRCADWLELSPQHVDHLRRGAAHEDPTSWLALEQLAHRGNREARRFAGRVDDLGHAFARLAVRVNLHRCTQHGRQSSKWIEVRH